MAICMLLKNNAAAQSSEFDTIMNRIRAELMQNNKDEALAKTVEHDMASLQKDGSWADINYANPEFAHLKRIENFAVAYKRPSNKFYGDKAVHDAILQSLQFWVDKNPMNKNWWFNQISFPQTIGQILIILKDDNLPLKEILLARMIKGDPVKSTGANQSDISLHYLYRACLTKNAALMDTAVTNSFAPIKMVNGGEGIQYDNSYFQHGEQQAIASYGQVFMDNSFKVAYYLRGTNYAMPTWQLSILTNFYIHTFLQSIRGAYYDFNVRGRGISRVDSMEASAGLAAKANQVDPANGIVYTEAIARISKQQPASYHIQPLHTHYFRGDYDLHIRSGFSFNVKTVSTRTIRTERGNNENILGKLLPDGSTDIQRRGGEYANLMPIWDWNKIPGTTARDYIGDDSITIKKEWGIPGTTRFVGGVSDSLYGATVYDLDYDHVKAKKAWFFFDKEVVCLGAGINSGEAENISTTINQCWLNGQVLVSKKREKTSTLKNENLTNFEQANWVLHDSIGYFFPSGENISVSNQAQSGNWYHINNGYSKNQLSGHVFKLWLQHGVHPADADYAYIVVPNMGNSKEMDKYPLSNIKIISNTKEIQAVQNIALDMLQIVFYKAGEINDGAIAASVDKPCIVYLKDIGTKKISLHIADPAQLNTVINVTLKLPGMNKTKQIMCGLPQSPYLGATASFIFSKD